MSTDTLENQFRTTCEEINHHEGACFGIHCPRCPFSLKHNGHGVSCVTAGYNTLGIDVHEQDIKLLASAIVWLEAHPEKRIKP